MIKFEDILKLIERSKTPYVQISDLHGNKIYEVANSTVNATVQDLQEMEPMLRMYGKLEVKASNESGHKANYKGAYKWIMIFDKAEVKSPGSYMANPWQMSAAPPGFVHNSDMMFRMKELELKMEFEKKQRELEEKFKKEDDPIAKYGQYFPILMSIMGKGDDQIEKMIKWHVMSKGMGMPAASTSVSGPPTTTLTFKDVEKMNPEEKNNQIDLLLQKILEKVNADRLIILLKAFDDKPELAVKAVSALPLLTMGDPVIPAEKFICSVAQEAQLNIIFQTLPDKVTAEHIILLFEAVNKNPELVEKAITYLPMMM